MKLSWDSLDFPKNVEIFLSKYLQNMAFNSNKYKQITVKNDTGVFYIFEKEEPVHLHFSDNCLRMSDDGGELGCLDYDGLEIKLRI